ncbi:MAG: hypothetical protein COC01_02140 [Bacteroidetes bacterium]|nr:MAG: hypothetical protein COC01_02140 [Bacteroidota bacterium]
MKKLTLCFFLLITLLCNINAQIIETIVGTGVYNHYCCDGGPADSARLGYPTDVHVDATGNIYIADRENHRIRLIDTSGVISTIAGTGISGFSGDGSLATAAQLTHPTDVHVDATGNIYIADEGNNRIRLIDTSGMISTIAGTISGFSGDGGPATSARMYQPGAVYVDAEGNVYIADTYNHRIRLIDTSGVISTIAGTGTEGFAGDGSPATSAQLNRPYGIHVDAYGNIYIADASNQRIRLIDTSGVISTIAGTGIQGSSGNGGPATSAQLNFPKDVHVDPTGNIYIVARNSHRILLIDSAGIITKIVGLSSGFTGDGGQATSATLSYPTGVHVDATGNIYIADKNNLRIRLIDTSGIINTIAGGSSNLPDDGGPANLAQLGKPTGVHIDETGNIYIVDQLNHRIRFVDTSGVISTIAGAGAGGSGFSGDGGSADTARFFKPQNVHVDAAGNIYIADLYNHRIRLVDTSGVINTIAGTGISGFSGDGSTAISAQLNRPYGIHVDATGNIYIADTYNNRIRLIDTSGMISTIAGIGSMGFSGDSGPATAAELYYPWGVHVDATGNIYIADLQNHRIRLIDTSGVISTIAGTGISGFSGDGSLATAAQLSGPSGVHVDASGNIYIVDKSNHSIRKIDITGIITTIAGTGSGGFSGDGGPANSAKLSFPVDVHVDASGNIYIADSYNNRIRRIYFPPEVSYSVSHECSGSNDGSVKVISTGINTPYTFSWSTGEYTDSIGNLSAGSYIVTITNTKSENVIDTVVILALPLPIVSLGIDTLVCDGDSILLNAGTGPYIYLWNDSSTNQNLTVYQDGSYYVSITDTNGCGKANDTILINKVLLPVSLGNDTALCLDNSFKLNAGADYSSYLWNDIFLGGQTLNVPITIVDSTVIKSSSDSITIPDDGCSTSNSVEDSIYFSGFNNLIVSKIEVFNLNITHTYDEDLQISLESPSGTSVILSSFNGGSGADFINTSFSDSALILINSASAPFTGTFKPDGNLSDFIGESINGNWIINICDDYAADTGFLSSWQIGITYIDTIASSSAGSYYVVVTDTNGCTNSSDTINVSVNSLPTVNLGNDTSFCAGNILDPGNGFTSYSWSDNSSTQTISVNATGSYWVEVSDSNGCSIADTVNITVINPTVDIGADTGICIGGSLLLDAGNSGNTFTWSDNSTLQTLTVDSTGTYFVQITDTNGCGNSDTINVTVNPLPIVTLGNDTTLCNGNNFNLSAGSFVSYSWADGSTSNSLVVSAVGTYWVEVTDTNNCTSIPDTVSIMYTQCDSVWPGDCNYNGKVHWSDLFLLGRYFGRTGLTRTTSGILWQAYDADNWGSSTKRGVDFKHLDCDGSGKLNRKDAEAVKNNYKKSHAKSGHQNNPANPDLYFEILSGDIAPGSTVEVAILAGRDTSISLYGIGFEINLNKTIIANNTLDIDFEQGILGGDTSHMSIIIGKDTTANYIIGAIVRTDTLDINDFGEIARLTFQIDSNATIGDELDLAIVNSGGFVSSEDSTDYNHPAGEADTTITIVPPKGIHETFNYSKFKLYPNPTDNSVTFDLPIGALGSKYEFMNNIGQVVLTGNLTSKTVDVSKLQQGLYHVKVYSTKGIYYQELEILR